VVAALSNRKESLVFDLRSFFSIVLGHARAVTDFAATFRYIELGVRNSAESEVHSGTRFGGFGAETAEERVLRIASRDGWTVS